jgi:hypothetical protein
MAEDDCGKEVMARFRRSASRVSAPVAARGGIADGILGIFAAVARGSQQLQLEAPARKPSLTAGCPDV